MAWQNSAMGGNGGGPGSSGEGSSHGNQPQGTEYTLQGEPTKRTSDLEIQEKRSQYVTE